MATITIRSQDESSQIVCHRCQIDVVVNEVSPSIATLPDPGDQISQVSIAFETTGLFFTRCRIHPVVHLVQRSLRIHAKTFEPAVISVFDKIVNGKEFAVMLDSHGKCEMVAIANQGALLMSQSVPELGFICEVCQPVKVLHSGNIVAESKTMVLGKINIQTLLDGWKSRRRLAMQIKAYVVVEFAIVVDRSLSAAR